MEAGLGQDRDQLGREIRPIIEEGRGYQEVRRAPGALQYKRGREPGRRQGRRELAHGPVLLADILQRVRYRIQNASRGRENIATVAGSAAIRVASNTRVLFLIACHESTHVARCGEVRGGVQTGALLADISHCCWLVTARILIGLNPSD